MPDFQYVAVEAGGRRCAGRVEALDRHHALRTLRRRGLTPIELKAATAEESPPQPELSTKMVPKRRMWRWAGTAKVGSDELLAFIQELASLLRAGLPLDRALRVLSEMQSSAAMREIQRALLKEIKSGRSLSQALAAQAPLFGPLHINMVRAGEISGKLPEALGLLLEHLERAKTLRSTLVSALIYPTILLVAAVLSVALMLGFVVPQFKPMFEDLGDRLPILTAAVVALGDGVVRYGTHAAVAITAGGVLLGRWWRTPTGRRQKERVILTLPLVGPLIRQYQVGRFVRTLGTLLSSGVSLIPSLGIAKDGLTYDVLRSRLEPVSSAIKQGQRLSQAIANIRLLDPAGLQLIALGEETGRLDAMLLELAKRQEHAVELQTRRLLTLLEPVLILGLGAVIAIIIMAILLGILSVNELVV